jgi:hypothetical protein
MKKKDPTLHEGQLGNLLLRYKKVLKPPQQSVIKEVVQVIQEVLGVTVATSQLTYQVTARIIYIKTPSLIRSEILRAKPKILTVLKERLGEQVAPIDLI